MADKVVARLTAVLGFKIDRKGLKNAEQGLSKVAKSAKAVLRSASDANKAAAKTTTSVAKTARATASGLQKTNESLQEATKRARTAGSQFVGMAKKIRAFGIAAAAALAGSKFISFINDTTAAADSLAKTSRRLGITSAALENLRFAADRSGVSQSLLDASLRRFNKRIGLAAKGTGEAVKTYEELGIALKDNNGRIKPTPKLFGEVARALDGIEGQAAKTAVLVKIFGDEAADLLSLFEGGSEGLEQLIKTSESFGNVTEEQTKAAEAYQDSLTDLNTSFSRVARSVVTFILPAAKAVVDALTATFQFLSEESDSILRIITILGIGLAIFAKGAIAAAVSTAAAWLAAAAPFILIAALIAAVVLIVEELIATFQGGDTFIRDFIDSLFGIGTTTKVVEALKEAFTATLDAISSTAAAVWEGITDGAAVAWDTIKELFESGAKFVNGIIEKLSGPFESVSNLLSAGASALGFGGDDASPQAAALTALPAVAASPQAVAAANTRNVQQSNNVVVNIEANTNASATEIAAEAAEQIRAINNQQAAAIDDLGEG